MHKFTQKQNLPHQQTVSQPSTLSKVTRAINYQTLPILVLQQTIGNQAVQRLLRANTEDLKVTFDKTATVRLYEKDEDEEEDTFFSWN